MGDMTKRSDKQYLKEIIKHRVDKEGDRILWGRPLRLSEKEILSKERTERRVKENEIERESARLMVLEEGLGDVIAPVRKRSKEQLEEEKRKRRIAKECINNGKRKQTNDMTGKSKQKGYRKTKGNRQKTDIRTTPDRGKVTRK